MSNSVPFLRLRGSAGGQSQTIFELPSMSDAKENSSRVSRPHVS